MAKTRLVQQANQKLHLVQEALAKIYKDKQIDLHVEDVKSNDIRFVLASYRRRLELEKQSRDVIACQEAIHAALIFFAKHFPLNQRVGDSQLICPLTGQLFEKNSGITLSNGCQYARNTIGYVAEGKKYYPKSLPGSVLTIDRRDVKEAQRILKVNMVILGMRGGSLVGILLWLSTLAVQIGLGVSFSAMLTGALVGLGMGAVAASFITGGLILVPFLACVAIGGALGAMYFSKKYPSEFALKKTNDTVRSSTAVSFEKMEAKPDYQLDVQPTPELEEAQPLLPAVRTEYVFEQSILKPSSQ